MFGVVGLDPSLRVPAGVELDDAGRIARALVLTTSKTDVAKFGGRDARVDVRPSPEVVAGDEVGGWRRLVAAADALTVFAWLAPVSYVGIEGHAFSRSGSAQHRLGHLQGIVRYGLTTGVDGRPVGYAPGLQKPMLARPIPWLVIEPNVVKLFATGDGHAEKAAMVAAAVRAGFHQLSAMTQPTAEGLADAYWIARVMQTWVLLKRERLHPARLHPRIARLFAPRKPGVAGLLDRPLMTP